MDITNYQSYSSLDLCIHSLLVYGRLIEEGYACYGINKKTINLKVLECIMYHHY